MTATPTRRVVLATVAALPLAALSGCDGVDVLATPPPAPRDVRLLRAAIAAEQLMVTRYAAVLRGLRGSGAATSAAGIGGAAPGGLAGTLDPLLAEHQAHLAQLRSRLIVPSANPGAAASPSARHGESPAAPTAPGPAVAFLRSAEQAAAAAMLDRLPGVPAALAQLFASISASEATHVPVLDRALVATAALEPAGKAR